MIINPIPQIFEQFYPLQLYKKKEKKITEGEKDISIICGGGVKNSVGGGGGKGGFPT